MTKLAIVEDREEDKWDHTTTVKCWKCDRENGVEIPEAVNNPKVRLLYCVIYAFLTALQVKSVVDGVMHSLSSARQSEVKAWEEDITACEHTLTLEQQWTDGVTLQASGIYFQPLP